MKLLSLPVEIIEYIIHLTCLIHKEDNNQFHGWRYPEYNYVELKSMGLTCKHLYIIISPFLWKHKEFILPREDDEKSENVIIQMATDILSKKALFQQENYLGEYVQSLSRDLTNGSHYDLNNSKLMAQLVYNLRALKIDFHPKARTEKYGLDYFIKYCSNLNELYLSNCRDTFDDFKSIYEFKPNLISLTLIECTIKESTLEKISNQLNFLKNLLLQQVLIEPSITTKSNNTHLIDTNQFIHPFHYQNINSTAIPISLYQSLLKRSLTNLALTDSISWSLLQLVINYSPQLEKLAIVLHELNPFYVNQSIQSISKLSNLTTLSLAFRRYYPLSKEYERLPCHVPTYTWNLFSKNLPCCLKLLYISTTRLLVDKNFISNLLNNTNCSNIIIHNIALVTRNEEFYEIQDQDQIRDTYLKESQFISYNLQDWNNQDYLYTFKQAKELGYHCFDESDQVCFIK